MTVGQMKMHICIVRKSVHCFQCGFVCLFISRKVGLKDWSSNDGTCPSPPIAASNSPRQGCALDWLHCAASVQPPTVDLSWGRGCPDCTHNLRKEIAGKVPSGTLPQPLESSNKTLIMVTLHRLKTYQYQILIDNIHLSYWLKHNAKVHMSCSKLRINLNKMSEFLQRSITDFDNLGCSAEQSDGMLRPSLGLFQVAEVVQGLLIRGSKPHSLPVAGQSPLYLVHVHLFLGNVVPHFSIAGADWKAWSEKGDLLSPVHAADCRAKGEDDDKEGKSTVEKLVDQSLLRIDYL